MCPRTRQEEAAVIAEIRTHNGVSYLYADYQGAQTSEDFFGVLGQGDGLLKTHPDVSRILANYSGTVLTPEYSQTLKEIGSTGSYKTAAVGIEGFNKITIDTIQVESKFDTKIFADEEAALDWLLA
jgi:hypothetical protein